jgi:cytochrome c
MPEHKSTGLALGRMTTVFGVLSVALLVALAIAPARGHFTEWREVQNRYNDGAAAAGVGATDVHIRQIWIHEIGVVDRCSSCHIAMAGDADPVTGDPLFGAHPPIPHDPAEIGCTPCHGGQGRGTTREDAHGRVRHWADPILPAAHTEAGCGTCHTGISVGSLDLVERGGRLFERHDCLGCHVVEGRGGARIAPEVAPDLSGIGMSGVPEDWHERHLDRRRMDPGGHAGSYGIMAADDVAAISAWLSTLVRAPRLMAAKRLFHEYGCLGCHKVNGVGGDEGAELTRSAQRSLAQYVFPPEWRGPRTRTEWHVRHLLDPRAVVVDSTMPDLGLTPSEAESMTLYLMSLNPRVLPVHRAPPDRVRVERLGGREFGTDGSTLVRALCGACHGTTGEGRDAGELDRAYPALTQPDLLAIASDDDLRRVISAGRPGRRMPAWDSEGSGLESHEIGTIVRFLRASEAAAPLLAQVRAATTDPDLGRTLYARECAVCHGTRGEGLLGPSHSSPAFGRIAGDRFVFETIVGGRPGTAMPRFRDFTAHEVSSLINQVLEFSKAPYPTPLVDEPPGDPAQGREAYAASCARCHGEWGEGAAGPGIGRAGFHRVATPAFVIESYASGRCRDERGTVAPRLERSILRDIAAHLPLLGADGKPGKGRQAAGDPERGALTYKRFCSGCHGDRAQGLTAPSLVNPGLLDSVADGFLVATILRGRRGTSMPRFDSDQSRFPRLSASEVEDVVVFIRRSAKEAKK